MAKFNKFGQGAPQSKKKEKRKESNVRAAVQPGWGCPPFFWKEENWVWKLSTSSPGRRDYLADYPGDEVGKLWVSTAMRMSQCVKRACGRSCEQHWRIWKNWRMVSEFFCLFPRYSRYLSILGCFKGSMLPNWVEVLQSFPQNWLGFRRDRDVRMYEAAIVLSVMTNFYSPLSCETKLILPLCTICYSILCILSLTCTSLNFVDFSKTYNDI